MDIPFIHRRNVNAHGDRQPTGVTQHMSLAASYCFGVLPNNFRDRGKTCIRTFIETIAFIFGRGSNTVKKTRTENSLRKPVQTEVGFVEEQEDEDEDEATEEGEEEEKEGAEDEAHTKATDKVKRTDTKEVQK